MAHTHSPVYLPYHVCFSFPSLGRVLMANLVLKVNKVNLARREMLELQAHKVNLVLLAHRLVNLIPHPGLAVTELEDLGGNLL